MPMRRVLLLLVLANLVAFLWWRGYLDDLITNAREPERIRQQVEPDRLRVAPPERTGSPGG